MEESVSLVDVTTFGIEDLGISRVNNVLDDVGRVIHLGFCVLLMLLLILEGLVLLLVLFHHVFLADLVEALAHGDQLLLLEAAKALELHELDVLQGTLWRLFLLGVDDLGQQRIRRQ